MIGVKFIGKNRLRDIDRVLKPADVVLRQCIPGRKFRFTSYINNDQVRSVPDQIRRMMPKLGISDGQMQPLCHGYARGLLGWFLECEARASG